MVSSGKAEARVRMQAGLFLPPVSQCSCCIASFAPLLFNGLSAASRFTAPQALKQAAIGSQ